MKKSQVTARQVAQHAGVSQTTVSFVLNNVERANISEATRERVLNSAKALGYVPTAAARTLARGTSSSIGMVIVKPHQQVFIDPYIPNVMTGLNQATSAQGYRILFEMVNDLNPIRTIERLLRSGEVAGVVVIGLVWGNEQALHPLLEEGYPIIVTDQVDSPLVPTTYIDHIDGVRQMMAHLTHLGHRRIACITYGPNNPHLQRRINAYREGLEAAGIAYDDNLLRYGAYEPESGYTAMQSLLQVDPLPTAVFCMNDLMALGALKALEHAGLRVPEDIAVAGYDDMRFAPYTTPALTTISAPEVQVGIAAGQQMIDLIHRHDTLQVKIILSSKLVVRESCGGR
jgi:LacI family transcriptional regulator